MPTITPSLWFDFNLEEAMAFYASVFPDSSIGEVTRYGEGGPVPAGTALSADFVLAGNRFNGINGGPDRPFTEAVSLLVECSDQVEIDYYWDALTADGGAPGQCGWLTDKFGLSWQIVPNGLTEMLTDSDSGRVERTMAAILSMTKLDIAELDRAAAAG